jgi:glycosyltransferase involved in cell wall biosynthesis
LNRKRISGFTFIKGGLTLGYPIKESIESVDPFCDEIIINVGYDDPNCQKDDGTYDYLRDHFKGDRYVFLKSHWDPNMTSNGTVLAEQTNIALRKCTGKYCQYIQGDEVLHEEDYKKILKAVDKMDENEAIEGLVFDYVHFYCSANVIKRTRDAYRREVRVIRNGRGIYSFRDAQGFKVGEGKKLKCILADAKVYHYGWARLKDVMKRKVQNMGTFYHGKDFKAENEFEYARIWGVREFEGTHPKNMNQWIEENRNDIDVLSLKLDFRFEHLRNVISEFIENLTGYRVGEYKNYKIIP